MRSNKYPGRCTTCNAWVEADAGKIAMTDGRWTVECLQHERASAEASAVGAAGVAGVVSTPYSPVEPSAPNGAGSGVLGGASSPSEYTLISGHAASAHQAAVFDHFRYGRGSRIVKAVAGAGKTTTIKNMVRFADERQHVLLLAFNVEAAGQLKAALVELRELEGRRYANVNARTFHSLGVGAVRRYLRGRGVELLEPDSGKCSKLFRSRVPEEVAGAYGAFVTALVAYAKGEGIGALAPDVDERWYALVEHHGLYLEVDELDDGTPVTEEVAIDLARKLLRWSNEEALRGSIDFDDMLYLVVLWKLRLWQHDVVCADECQDTNAVRRALLRLALKPNGKLYAVGDPKQSIYGFTGASTDAMDLISREFNTRELPLTVSYRCARAVVETAQTWCPYIEPAPGATEGRVLEVSLHEGLSELGPRDAVLCRNTRPLVTLAYGLIARGRACRIMGREIGEGLVTLVERQRASGISRLIEKLEVFRSREMAKFTAKGDERRAEGVSDKVGCVLTIIESLDERSRTVPALLVKVRGLFSDTDTGVLTLATVHKAKGGEWQKVAILRPDLMPSLFARQAWAYEQELNLCYVAATRAKETLIYCAPNDEAVDKKEAA
jgi:DNA helicase-2/ATP-dependent DNA helicase PcrA